MTEKIRDLKRGVTLVGGGPAPVTLIRSALALAPELVAADGGANHLAGAGLIPSALIGDLDSLENREDWRARLGDDLIHVADQESTDFEKCLARINAPFFIGVGFLGGRQDHTLAALHALIDDPRPIVLLGQEDLAFAPTRAVDLTLPVRDRISIFPLRSITASGGDGLKYTIEGLAMEAGAQIGTSNEAAGPTQSFAFDRPGAIVFLRPERLEDALHAQGALSHSPI